MRERITAGRDRVRRMPGGNALIRASVLLLGGAFIAVGLVAVVLPGPFTIPPVVLGLAIWSLEFDFARRWLQRAKAKLPRRKRRLV